MNENHYVVSFVFKYKPQHGKLAGVSHIVARSNWRPNLMIYLEKIVMWPGGLCSSKYDKQ